MIGLPLKVKQLMEKGVKIPVPFTVDIGEEINLNRISGEGVILYPGTRIYGKKALISSGVKLGHEAPVTIMDCQLGPQVELKGGFFKSSVFLEKANVAYGAQIREGCLLEEEANGSHTVGMKQTILFPFVTLGSLINFCDCFMAGGTSRKNHSEVGSSYIHFNYTPNQDKATPSLIGCVPRGVMLNQPPIFLGGQGGLVGPARIGYGTVIAAGTIYRKDCPEGGKLISEGNPSEEKVFRAGFYGDIKRRTYNNICYLANLLALKEWYIHVRQPFFKCRELGEELYAGALDTLQLAIDERLKRFRELSAKMEKSMIEGRNALGKKMTPLFKQQKELYENWPKLEACFNDYQDTPVAIKTREAFLEALQHQMIKRGSDYISCIQGLDPKSSALGTTWLQDIVDHIIKRIMDVLPSHHSS
jgi:hypothetical protein